MEISRRAPRITLEARIEGHAESWANVRVLDLSPSGALLESRRSLEEGSTLKLKIALEREPLKVRAKVVHCSEARKERYRTGVQFVAPTAEQQERIREYLRQSFVHDRREQPRIFVGQRAQLGKEIELRVLNLSLFGGLFSTRAPLDFDSEHAFVFELPRGTVHARGIVRHCEAWAQARGVAVFRLGVEFTELAGENHDRVLRYLEEQIEVP